MQDTEKIDRDADASAGGAGLEGNSPIVDLNQLFLLSAGDSAFQKVMVEIFLDSAPEVVETMRRLARIEDVGDAWKQAAHKLAGSAAQISAARVVIAARNAEASLAPSLQEKAQMVYNIENHLSDFRQFFTGK